MNANVNLDIDFSEIVEQLNNINLRLDHINKNLAKIQPSEKILGWEDIKELLDVGENRARDLIKDMDSFVTNPGSVRPIHKVRYSKVLEYIKLHEIEIARVKNKKKLKVV